MRWEKISYKKSLKLNYNIIIVIHLAVFIQVFSILMFPIPLAAAKILCEVQYCDGTDGDDLMEAAESNPAYETGAAHLWGYEGDDQIYGSSYRDEILGWEGNDKIYGKGDNDKLIGGFGDDEMHGGPGNDEISGHEGADLISGGEGDDIIRSYKTTEGVPEPDYSKDVIRCGPGDDKASINTSEDGDEAADDCENIITG